MKLLRCHIDNFGKLSNADFSFTEGLNTILRENGSGKTTLAVFLKAMLFDLTVTSERKDPYKDERKRYNPWQGGAYGGWLEFEAGGRTYRIDRSYASHGKKGTNVTVVDLETQKETDAFGDAPGMVLLGIHEYAFENTLYFSQRALTGEEEGIRELNSRLISMEEANSVADMDSYDDAVENIKKASNALVKKDIGAVTEKELEIREKIQKAKDAGVNLKTDRKALTDLQAQLTDLEKAEAADFDILQSASVLSLAGQEENLQNNVENIKKQEENCQNALHGIPDDPVFWNGLKKAVDDYVRLAGLTESGRLDKKDLDEFQTLLNHFREEKPDRTELNGILSEFQAAESEKAGAENAYRIIASQKENCPKDPLTPEDETLAENTVNTLRQIELQKKLQSISDEDVKQLSDMREQYGTSDKIGHDIETVRDLSGKIRDCEEKQNLSEKKRTADRKRAMAVGGIGACLMIAGVICGLVVTPVLWILCGIGALAAAYAVWTFLQSGKKAADNESLDALKSSLGEISRKYGFSQPDEAAMEHLKRNMQDLEAEEENVRKNTQKLQRSEEEYVHNAEIQLHISDLNAEKLDALIKNHQILQSQFTSLQNQWLEKRENLQKAEDACKAANVKMDQLYARFGYDRNNVEPHQLVNTILQDYESYGRAADRLKLQNEQEEKLRTAESNLAELLKPWLGENALTCESAKQISEMFTETLLNLKHCRESLEKGENTLEKFRQDHKDELEKAKHLKESGIAVEDSESVNARISARKQDMSELRNQIFLKQQDIKTETDLVDSVSDLEEVQESLKRKKDALYHKCDLLSLAQTYLTAAKDNLSSRYLKPMRANFTRYLKLLDATHLYAEHPDASVDTDLNIKISANGAARGATAFSEGQKDILAICRHLALTDAIFESHEETPFLILDDPFVNLDDQALASAMSLVRAAAEKYQIIYMTCHSSRQ